jgi:hypothetical protein
MFKYRMVHTDGTPADPPQFVSAIPDWRVGDDVRVGAEVRYRIVGIDAATDDVHGVWIVDPCPERRLGGEDVAA